MVKAFWNDALTAIEGDIGEIKEEEDRDEDDAFVWMRKVTLI